MPLTDEGAQMKKRTLSQYVPTMLAKINRVSTVAGTISGILAFCLMIWISADVFLRFFFDKPIPGSSEISRIALAWICFLGIVYAYTRNAHVRVTLFISRFPKYRPLFEFIACSFGVLIFGVLTYMSWLYFWDSWINQEFFPAPITVPYWLAKLSMPVGVFIFAIALLLNMISHILDLFEKRQH